MINSDIIILAGGLGTRLKHLIPDTPKPMAVVNGKPFLQYLLNDLSKQGAKHVILSVGYKHQQIINYFGHSFKSTKLTYSVENTPLGTGGAIKKALEKLHTTKSFILNGDTFFEVDLSEMEQKHEKNIADLSIAVKKMTNYERYGSVNISHDLITGFEEKMHKKKGFINGGIYMINKDLLATYNLPDKFSFEKDFMENCYPEIKCMAYESKGYFIDIGVPDDFKKAQTDFKILKWH